MSDIFCEMRSATSGIDLWKLLTNALFGEGAKGLGYLRFAPNGAQMLRPVMLHEGMPETLADKYASERLYMSDPATEYAQTSAHPILWSDVVRNRRLRPDQRRFARRALRTGLSDGLSFQVFGPGAANGIVMVSMPQARDLSTRETCRIYHLAQAAHLRFFELDVESSTRADLSPRERQILYWITNGKSNASIAEIIGVSAHTVDTTVRRLFEKMGVANRTMAGVLGVASGLILPS